MKETSTLPIAIIGGGFSGSAVALQLRRMAANRRILLFERTGRFGPGLAYATLHVEHLLNVPSHNMSAYPDEPDHFERWLTARPGTPTIANTDAGVFAPRWLYGEYIADELFKATLEMDRPPLDLVGEDVTDIVPTRNGFDVTTACGERYPVAEVILALGHPRPGASDNSAHRVDPWADNTLSGIHLDQPLLVVGTGLTMVDIAVTLHQRGMRAPIFAVSRHGLLPRRHQPRESRPPPEFSAAERHSIRLLLRRFRREVRQAEAYGTCWRSVIDSLRPITQQLWQGLPDSEKAGFIRHLRTIWDVHRHRMAPPVADVIDGMMATGSLTVISGRVAHIEACHGGAKATIRSRGVKTETDLSVQCVIDATGSDRQCAENPLLAKLFGGGLLRAGPLDLGIQVDRNLRAVPANGNPLLGIYAVGPITRGVFWECTAVPDIRTQAAQLASALS